MKLPVLFKEKMQRLLGDEYEDYLESYNNPKYQGIRINTMKVSDEEWKQINPFTELQPVPWCKEGYYYTEPNKPSKHPYYFAGLYYMQEPSAMAPGAYVPIKEGDKVLDLCAAPGGKTTQVLAKLNQTGVLISNDISASRTQALLKNVENFGARNTIITNETPERLASKLPGYFDKILIDAPCSGEGMFRKDEGAIKSWETHGVEHCQALQREILEYAYAMLKEEGMILYSTCTFSPEENEGMIQEFLNHHPLCEVVPLTPVGGIATGHPEWTKGGDASLKGALRLWPHHLQGEGHFVCLIQKKEPTLDLAKRQVIKKRIKDIPALSEFIETYTHIDTDTPVIEVKDKVFMAIEDAPDLQGLRIVRSGMLLGELKSKRFEPAHAPVLAYSKEMFKQTIDLAVDDVNVIKYLKGETLLVEAQKGYHVICVEGHPLGFVKSNNGTLKNQYPPHWRMMG